MPNDLIQFFNMVVINYIISPNCLYYINTERENVISLINTPTISMNSVDSVENFDKFNCQNFIIYAAQPTNIFENIENILRLTKISRYNRRRYLLIGQDIFNISGIFNRDAFYNVADIIVASIMRTEISKGNKNLFREGQLCINLFTNKYVGKDSGTESIFIKRWCGENINLDLFSAKLENQMGRKLRIPSFDGTPYFNINTGKGSELKMLMTFMIKYNITPSFIHEEGKWGAINETGQGYGALYQTAIGETDITIGGYYRMFYRYQYFDFSEVTIRMGINVLVPPPRIATGWKAPFRSFRSDIWIAIGVTFFCSLFIEYLSLFVKNGGDFQLNILEKSLMNMLSIYLQQPSKIYLRMFGAILLLRGVFLEKFYSCRLASVIAKPSYIGQIQMPFQLEHSDLDVVVYSKSYVYYLEHDKRYQSLISRVVILNETELLNTLRKKTHLTIVVDHLEGGYTLGEYGIPEIISRLKNFKLLQEDLSYEYCVIFAVKHSIIMPLFNKHVLSIKESGLHTYWENEALFCEKKGERSFQMFNFYEEDVRVRQLKLQNIEGIFIIWALLLAVSSILFMLELFLPRKYIRTY